VMDRTGVEKRIEGQRTIMLKTAHVIAPRAREVT